MIPFQQRKKPAQVAVRRAEPVQSMSEQVAITLQSIGRRIAPAVRVPAEDPSTHKWRRLYALCNREELEAEADRLHAALGTHCYSRLRDGAALVEIDLRKGLVTEQLNLRRGR